VGPLIWRYWQEVTIPENQSDTFSSLVPRNIKTWLNQSRDLTPPEKREELGSFFPYSTGYLPNNLVGFEHTYGRFSKTQYFLSRCADCNPLSKMQEFATMLHTIKIWNKVLVFLHIDEILSMFVY
jgi:hypothetical protein